MTNLFSRICISFSKLLPEDKRKDFQTLIRTSGKNHDSNIILGLMLFFVFIIFCGFLIYFFMFPFSQNYVPIADIDGFILELAILFDGELVSGVVDGLSIFQKNLIYWFAYFGLSLIIIFLFHFYYFFISEKRAKFVNNILPDVLSLIASNINSGLTPYHSVKGAIRDDFGPLADSFQIATNKSIGNKAFHESIREISDDFNSDSLKRSMNLFSAAIESGSNMNTLLKNLAKDIRERQSLKNELITSTKTNSMFILFMVVVGAPILMSISIFFVDIVTGILGKSSLGDTSNMGMSMGNSVAITSGFLNVYSIIFFIITGIIVSYFSGVIVEGDGKNGLKKAPLIVVGSITVFIISLYLVRYFLGGIF